MNNLNSIQFEKEYIYCLLVEDHPVTNCTKVPL